ncbi:hypothetical protein [Halarcobacter sp.]|uniref:hypothetical protein n=1 Tax=Halarcobacter sp. TaxID=2321133 RepID=UPI003AFFB2FD
MSVKTINNESQNNKDEVLFEMLDYSALTIEITFLVLAIIVTIDTSIGYGGFFEAIHNYSYLGYISMIYIYTRESKFLYRFFYLKKYKLIFYKDRIIQTSTDKTFFLNTINEAYNIKMYISAQYSTNKISRTKYFISLIVVLIGLPISLPLAIILAFVRVLPSWIIQKSLRVNNTSLVVTFPEKKAVNIPYGVLNKQEIEFLENYFKDYFEMQKLQKAFLYVPNLKGEENE